MSKIEILDAYLHKVEGGRGDWGSWKRILVEGNKGPRITAKYSK